MIEDKINEIIDAYPMSNDHIVFLMGIIRSISKGQVFRDSLDDLELDIIHSETDNG